MIRLKNFLCVSITDQNSFHNLMSKVEKNNVALAFFGHHKCATSWIIRMIRYLCIDLSITYENYHSPKMFEFDFGGRIKSKKIDFFSYTNADTYYVNQLDNNFLGFHVIRDPRDIVVSAYYSHLNSHPSDFWPELNDHRNYLKGLSIDEGLFYMMGYLDSMTLDGVTLKLFSNLENWDYERANILEIKFETLVFNPYFHMLEILKFLNLIEEDDSSGGLRKLMMGMQFVRKKRKKILIADALRIIYLFDFLRLTKGRKRGSEDLHHHYRKGVPGDWKNHFNDDHKEHFKKNYNNLLIKLGYEKNSQW